MAGVKTKASVKCEEYCSEFCEGKVGEELELCIGSCLKFCLASFSD